MDSIQGWIVVESDVAEVILFEPSWTIVGGYKSSPGKAPQDVFHAEFYRDKADASRNRNMRYLSSVLQVGNHLEDWYLALKDAGFKMSFKDKNFEKLMRGQYL